MSDFIDHHGVRRRSVAAGAVWAVPALAVGACAPALAASAEPSEVCGNDACLPAPVVSSPIRVAGTATDGGKGLQAHIETPTIRLDISRACYPQIAYYSVVIPDGAYVHLPYFYNNSGPPGGADQVNASGGYYAARNVISQSVTSNASEPTAVFQGFNLFGDVVMGDPGSDKGWLWSSGTLRTYGLTDFEVDGIQFKFYDDQLRELLSWGWADLPHRVYDLSISYQDHPQFTADSFHSGRLYWTCKGATTNYIYH